MKVCKIKPPQSVCSACADTSYTFGDIPNCKKCLNKDYELLGTHQTLFGRYAEIIKNGKIECIELSRVYDVRDAEVGQQNRNSIKERF